MNSANVVWKFPINPNNDVTKIMLPLGATPLSVQLQHNAVQLWVLCNPDEEICKERTFRLVATGEEFHEPKFAYIGTIQAEGGRYIFHLFEVATS